MKLADVLAQKIYPVIECTARQINYTFKKPRVVAVAKPRRAPCATYSLTRKCKHCKETKPLTEYYETARAGYFGAGCKVCLRAKRAEYKRLELSRLKTVRLLGGK
jgi:hypothetical protein